MSRATASLTEQDVAVLVDAWPVGRPRSIEALGSDSNNHNWVIRTPTETYFLRVYRNVDAETRIAFEHPLLQALAKSGLPFAVPSPLPITSGETLARFNGAIASLTREIPGRHPKSGDVSAARACAAALGSLDTALASIEIENRVPGGSGYADLWNVHSALMGPGEALTLLQLAGSERVAYEQAVSETESAWPALAASLPTQIIHSDYVRRNVLLLDGAVSGVLDFEFSGPDLRAMDLAVGIYHFCLSNWIGRDASLISELVWAFVQGISETMKLSRDEFEALPLLLLRRQLVVTLHWLGRWRVGLSSEADARERITGLSDLQRWLKGEGAEVLEHYAHI